MSNTSLTVAWPNADMAGHSFRNVVAPWCKNQWMAGCHARFDQYRLLPGGRDAHAAAGERWAARTREVIERSGLWPNGLQPWRK